MRIPLPLAPRGIRLTIRKPVWGAKQKSHFLTTTRVGGGEAGGEAGIPTFSINCMQIGSFPGGEPGVSASFMS